VNAVRYNSADFGPETVKRFMVPVPPIEDQRRIADFLDIQISFLDKLIAHKSRQKELYSAIHDSRRDEMLWGSHDMTLIPLRYLVRCNLNTLPSNTDPNFRFRYVDVSSVNFRTGIESPEESVSFEDAPSRARRVARTGDVIFSMVRPYLRAVSVLREEDSSMIYSTAFAVLQPMEVNSQYIFEVLTSNRFLSETEKWSAGMGYPAINESDLLSIKVPLPSSKNQQEIGKSLQEEKQKFEKIISKIEESLDSLRALKQSMITSAVTGKIDVVSDRSVA
jgi:type I restriction enzyme S subunit